jgi:hypothetical protein
MSEEAQKPDGQEPEGTDSQQTETFDRTYVEELRSEAKGYRLKLRDTEKRVEDLEAKLKDISDAEKPEVERLTEEKARLETLLKDREVELQTSAVNTAIRMSAVQANVVDVEAVTALIDRNEITFEDGSVAGVDKALKKLLKDKPYLIKGGEEIPPPTPGAGGTPMGQGNKKANLTDSIYKAMKSVTD